MLLDGQPAASCSWGLGRLGAGLEHSFLVWGLGDLSFEGQQAFLRGFHLARLGLVGSWLWEGGWRLFLVSLLRRAKGASRPRFFLGPFSSAAKLRRARTQVLLLGVGLLGL